MKRRSFLAGIAGLLAAGIAATVIAGPLHPGRLLIPAGSFGTTPNLLSQPEAFDNAVWTKTRLSISANAISAPDGTLTGDKLVEDGTAGANHYVLQAATPDGSSPYTLSIHAKSAERTQIKTTMQTQGFVFQATAYFDLDNCTIISSSGLEMSLHVQDAGGGWCRVGITQLSDAAVSTQFLFSIAEGETDTYDGDGTSGIYVWGAKLNIGENLGRY